jgi:hypothetical protein
MSLTPTPLMWDQGEDLEIVVTYSLNGTPQDLSVAGWAARMDIAKTNTTAPIISVLDVGTLNTAGADDDAITDNDEIELAADGLIRIAVSRDKTLTGDIATALDSATTAKYVYDLFIRNPDGYQKKIMEGEITVKRSVTKWL